MALELTPEEQAAVYFLVGSELQAAKLEEDMGEAPDVQEITILLSLLNKTKPEDQPIRGWSDIPPAPLEDDGEDGGELVERVL